jgi:hypothetical protein
VLASAGIYALDPQTTHVALLDAPVPVRILQRLLDALPGRANAVLAAPSEALGQLQNLLVVHLSVCVSFFLLRSYKAPTAAELLMDAETLAWILRCNHNSLRTIAQQSRPKP